MAAGLDVFRCTMLTASYAVIQYGGLWEGNGLEARFWIVSGLPTTRPESPLALH